MGNAASYKGNLAPKDVNVGGYTWVVRTITKAMFAKHFGGFNLLVQNTKAGMTKEHLDQYEQAEREVFDAYVDGIRDQETGLVEKVPYEDVLKQDFDALWPHVMGQFVLDSPKVDEIRGAL